jgi:hypothetical protein
MGKNSNATTFQVEAQDLEIDHEHHELWLHGRMQARSTARQGSIRRDVIRIQHSSNARQI